MKGISLNTLAHPRLDRARLHPSRRRVLAAPGFGTAANQRNFPDPLGFARPFAPSSPRPDTRLRAVRIGGFIRAFPATSPTHERRSCGPSPRRIRSADLQVLRLAIGKRIAPVDRIKPELFAIEGSHKQMDARPLAPSLHGHPASMRVGQGVNRRLPRRRTDHIRGRAHGQIRFALAGSTRTAYQGETPVLTVAFIVAEAFQHPLTPTSPTKLVSQM